VTKKYSYNSLSFVIFSILIVSAFSFFTFADDSTLTLFEDYDRDGLSNAEEESFGTNPKKSDSDGDGYSDGVEIESGYDPLIPAPGDKIIVKKEPAIITAAPSQTTNVTRKISEDLVSYLADAQESGDTNVTSEEFSQVISDAVEKEVTFESTEPIDLSTITIKDQSYPDLSEKKKKEKIKEDAIEYITATSYIFISNFPEGFFDQGIDSFQIELMQNFNTLSQSLTSFTFFENMAENAIKAEKQLQELAVPEDMLELHTEGLYLLRYSGDIYETNDYKNASSDIAPMIAALAQMQGVVELTLQFQEKFRTKLTQYDIEDVFLDL